MDKEALIEHLKVNTNDNDSKLVLADIYEEMGKSGFSNFLRLLVKLGKFPRWSIYDKGWMWKRSIDWGESFTIPVFIYSQIIISENFPGYKSSDNFETLMFATYVAIKEYLEILSNVRD